MNPNEKEIAHWTSEVNKAEAKLATCGKNRKVRNEAMVSLMSALNSLSFASAAWK